MPARPDAPTELPSEPTVADLIRQGATEFERARLVFGHGTDNAIDEAAALVFHALGLDHADAEAAYAVRPDATGLARVRALLDERIARRVPAAYLMGRMWFAGLEFEVDPSVIVPRSPFAELIHDHFEPWVDPARVRRILDIGTGSGCIAIACAVAFPQATVDAVDLSPQALSVAQRNVARHGVGNRVRLHRGDVYAPLGDARYDLIVSNPPYVSDAEMQDLPPEYRHEPDLALRAGADGLDVVRRILGGLSRHLEPDGALFVEVGDSDVRVQEAFPDLPLTWIEFAHGGGGVFLLRAEDLARRTDGR
jgi:ribosomal protein L3 glutamine methyltransferase